MTSSDLGTISDLSVGVSWPDIKDDQSAWKKNDNDEKRDFDLFVLDVSYFSGKLECYFRYKELDFKRCEPTIRQLKYDLYPNTGTVQVPQVFDRRDQKWLRDTTPIIEYLEHDKRLSDRKSILPSCPVQSFFCRLLEDFADEWLWRPAMYFRWDPSLDADQLSTRFTYGFARDGTGVPISLAGKLFKLRQRVLFVYGDGITNEQTHIAVREYYLRLLDILQEIFSKSPYLFGNRPTLADFGFAGPMFRHFSSDPTPRKIMQQRAPAVYEWISRLWNCKQSQMSEETGFPSDGKISLSIMPLLELCGEYIAYLHDNAVAFQQKKINFDFNFEGIVYPKMPVSSYRVWCRAQLQKHFNNLPNDAQQIVQSKLNEIKCWNLLWKDGIIECPPEGGTNPPFCIPHVLKQSIWPFSINEPSTLKWPDEPIFIRYIGYQLRKKIIKISVRMLILLLMIRFFWKYHILEKVFHFFFSKRFKK